MRSGYFAILMLGAGFAAISSPDRAAAQEAAPPPVEEGVEDIIITANRRDQSLQDVPVAVSAVSGEMAERMGISSTLDLPQIAPGLIFYPATAGAGVTIRGVSSATTSGDESANAVYIDGVYQANLPGLMFALNNIERVEVLKGPQGTLFGRNASGGLVHIITKRPSADPAVDLSVGYASFDTVEANFYGTAGLTGTLAADLAVYYQEQMNGWGRNLITGEDAYKGSGLGIRSKFLWQPTGRTDVTLALGYARARPASLQGNANAPGILDRALMPNAGFYNTISNVQTQYRVEQKNVALTVRHEMDWATLVNIASYDHTTIDQRFDQDASSRPITLSVIHRPQPTFTEEFQILAPADSRIQWIAGVFYYDNIQRARDIANQGTAFAPNTPTSFLTSRADMHIKSLAGYGQVTIPIVDGTNITGGLRFTSDRRRITGQTFTTAVPNGTAPVDMSRTDQKFTYRLGIDQKFGERVLAYATFSTGFKSGLYNIAAPASPAVVPQTLTAYEVGLKTQLFDNKLRFNISAFHNDFKEIQLRVVQAGVTRLFNATSAKIRGFDVDFEAAPTPELRINGGLSYLHGRYGSLPGAPFFGANPPTIGGQFQFTGDATGFETIQTPPWVVTLGGSYIADTGVGQFIFAANMNHTDRYFWDVQNRASQGRVTLLNASIKWTAPSQAFDVRLYVSNLTNEKRFASVNATIFGDTYYPAEPRVFGVAVGTHF